MIKNSVTKNSSDIEIIDLFALKSLNSEELEKVAAKHKIENPNNYLKQDLIFEILQSQMDSGGIINCSGVLEILPDNFATFSRSSLFKLLRANRSMISISEEFLVTEFFIIMNYWL